MSRGLSGKMAQLQTVVEMVSPAVGGSQERLLIRVLQAPRFNSSFNWTVEMGSSAGTMGVIQ